MRSRRPSSHASLSSPERRGRGARIVKVGLGIGLLAALLLWQDNGSKLIDVLAQFDPSYIFLLLLISLGLNGVSSVKWSLFVHADGGDISQIKLFNLYLIGKFFNNFLPSMVGGDLARAYLLGRTIRSQSRSFASVFLERATGVIGLTMLATCFALINPRMLENGIIGVAIAVSGLGCAIVLVPFYHPDLLLIVVNLVGKAPIIGRLVRMAEQIVRDVTVFRHRHRLLLLSLLYSLGFHLLTGLNVYVACLSVGLAPPLLDILAITPVILLLVMIPVSPNNLGWWEWCFSILLMHVGTTAAEGLAVALTLRAVTMVVSLAGGLLFLQHRRGTRPHNPKAHG